MTNRKILYAYQIRDGALAIVPEEQQVVLMVYTLYNAGKMNQPKTLTADVVGRCCESGDIIQKDVALAETQRGDTVAVLTTGAYNYSMASNYNRVCRPALVMVQSDRTYVAVRRETLEYLTQNDV